MRRPVRCLVVLGLAGVLVAGCGPDTHGLRPGPSVSVSASGSVSVAPSAGLSGGAGTALEAYRGMWRAYVEAIRIPDPGYPDLARYSQDDARAVFVRGLTSVQRDGLVGQGDVTLHPKVTTIRPDASPPTADIEDCVDTSRSHLVRQDGSPYQDTPGGNRAATARVTRQPDGTWKVSLFALRAVGTC